SPGCDIPYYTKASFWNRGYLCPDVRLLKRGSPLGSAVRWIIWLLLMSLVMGWLARSRLRRDAASDRNLLYQPTSTLIIGVVFGGFFLALAVLSYALPNSTGSLGISLFFAGFALMGAILVVEYVRVWY